MLEGETIEDHLVRKQLELDERLTKIRDSKKNDDLKGCTFHPQIYSGPSELSYMMDSGENIYRNQSEGKNFSMISDNVSREQNALSLIDMNSRGLSKRYI